MRKTRKKKLHVIAFHWPKKSRNKQQLAEQSTRKGSKNGFIAAIKSFFPPSIGRIDILILGEKGKFYEKRWPES